MASLKEQADIETLTALNRDYIHSVQHGDVRRFQEILAEDFLCSNPDASLVDKPQFLAQTARPVTISGLVAEDVRIRLLGDVAIIHGFSATSPSSMGGHATARRRARRATVATPTSGHGATGVGSRSRRM
jgi:hypothetical protein